MTDVEKMVVSFVWDVCQPLGKGLSSTMVRATESNQAAGTTLFVASTDSEDRAMDVVEQNWRLKNFRLNPVILDSHDPRRIVGRGLDFHVPKAGDDAGKLMGLVKWNLSSSDKTIVSVGEDHLNGFRSAGSVGFRSERRILRSKLDPKHPKYQDPVELDTPWGKEKWSGTFFQSPELMEFSSCALPMNPEALQRSYFQRAEGPSAPDAPSPEGDAPPDEWAWLDDEEAVSRVADALFPVFMARAMAALMPAEEEAVPAPADEPVADKAFRRLWMPRLRSFVRTDTDMRRILRAVLDTGPPPAARTLTPRGDGLDFLFTERS